MSKRIFSTATIIACFALVVSCKKKADAVPVPSDFGPLTTGSTWTYQSTTAGSPSTSYTLTATNRDTSINGKSFRVLTNSTGPNNYRNKTGNDYYSFGSFQALNLKLEQLYLKDNVDVNATWQSTQAFTVPQFPLPLTATFIYILKEKGISRNVNNKAFTNVIKVGLNISVSGGIGAVANADFYYAPGVGLIENTYNVNAIPLAQVSASSTTEILTSYSIK